MPKVATKKPDKFVLQHNHYGTIHQLRKDGQTWCGMVNVATNYTRRRLSKALEHPKANFCKIRGTCEAHR